MQRFRLDFENGRSGKFYGTSLEQLKRTFPDAISITPIYDLSHEKYCKMLLNKARDNVRVYEKRESIIYAFEFGLRHGNIQIELMQDKEDNTFYDYCKYKFQPMSKTIISIVWDISNPKSVWEKFFENTEISYKVIGFYKAGTNMPKLKKPKELSGVNGNSIPFSYSKGKVKCQFQYFVKNNDLYIKSNDFFSPMFRPDDEDIGMPLGYIMKKYFKKPRRERFIYPDGWGSVVIRQKAWLKFENIVKIVDQMNYVELSNFAMSLMREKHHFQYDFMQNIELITMFENLFKQLKSKKETNI